MLKVTNSIVHLVYSFGCGGLEKVIANLINHSTEYDVEHILISLTDDTSMLEQVDKKIKVFVLDKKSGNDVKSHFQLFSLLKKLKPQAINTYNFGTIEYHMVAKLAGVPTRVHSDHGRGGDDPAGKNKLHNFFRKFIANFITEYVVVSYDLFQWISKEIKVNRNKLSLLFNGVAVPAEIEHSSSSPKTFVTVGRLDKVKNQKLLIDAFAQAVNTLDGFEHCILNIVGDGPLYDELSSQISLLNMNDSIYLLGFRNDITTILKDSDIFVLSSVYEAMPMTILEAMANKTPVVCTNVGGISKFISEKQAWFVESKNCKTLANKLNEVRINDECRLEKVSNAFSLVSEKYDMKQMVKAYMAKYGIEKSPSINIKK
ncbi:glycosyltransferase [Colwellia hornerae]|uniref:Glycosyltransferase n=1 Tax=Colwellia hornerae TaxID=89402 RepID=A0A5C6QHS7_9GAMM|nr:glycosyltransferase [Colwellia hornerae]TWX58330.1 glycosyltransferase [Colwellia hornerae]TWX68439.1 glycosyltransferase [Colwellia hornerae]